MLGSLEVRKRKNYTWWKAYKSVYFLIRSLGPGGDQPGPAPPGPVAPGARAPSAPGHLGPWPRAPGPVARQPRGLGPLGLRPQAPGLRPLASGPGPPIPGDPGLPGPGALGPWGPMAPWPWAPVPQSPRVRAPRAPRPAQTAISDRINWFCTPSKEAYEKSIIFDTITVSKGRSRRGGGHIFYMPSNINRMKE